MNRQLGAGYHHALVDRYHETNRIGRTDLETHRPHPEEAHRSRVYPRSAHQVRKSATADLRCAVSKDGRWLGLACGRPSRRAQSFEVRAPQAQGGDACVAPTMLFQRAWISSYHRTIFVGARHASPSLSPRLLSRREFPVGTGARHASGRGSSMRRYDSRLGNAALACCAMAGLTRLSRNDAAA